MNTPTLERPVISPAPGAARNRVASSVDSHSGSVAQVSSSARPSRAKDVSFDMPTAYGRRGEVVPEASISARRQRLTWVGNMMVAVVAYAAITLVVFGASQLAARVKTEDSRVKGINAMNRSKMAIAAMDRATTLGTSEVDLDRWASMVGFSDAPSAGQLASTVRSAPAAQVTTKSAPLVPTGPSVRVVRVAAR